MIGRHRGRSDHPTTDPGTGHTAGRTAGHTAGHGGGHRDEISHEDGRRDSAAARHEADAHDRFGGTNFGAAFFGWLVAIAMTVLLTGVVGAIAAAAGSSVQVSQTDAEREAGTIGLVAAVVLAVVLLVAYYTGGYVAGRMSRFDGARQGLAVWLIGLVVTAIAVGLGLLFGAQYNVLDRVSLPQIPIPTDQLNVAGIVTALVIVVGTALAAVAGGKVGNRYHTKVDRVAGRH
jgi:amino acid transporter